MTSYHVITNAKESAPPIEFQCETANPVKIRATLRNYQDLPGSNLAADIACGSLTREVNHEMTHFSIGLAIATVPFSPDGSLNLELPDFAHDSVFLSLFPQAHFGFGVRWLKPDWRPYLGRLRLFTRESSPKEVDVADHYPNELTFDFVPM